MRRLVAALLLVWCGGVVHAESVDFVLLPEAGSSPSLSYQGGGGALVGSDLSVSSVIGEGTPVNDGTALTVQASLNFITGDLVTTTPNSWEFAGGGSFTIVGTVQGLIDASTTLYSGQFVGDTTITNLGGGVYKVLGGGVSGTLDPLLAAEFGQKVPDDNYPGGLSLLFEGSELPPGPFNDTRFNSGNFATHAAPEPSSVALLGIGAVGLFVSRKRFACRASRSRRDGASRDGADTL